MFTDGVIVIDKPPSWTSHDVVAKVRNITGVKKVGHTGTLDPFATGVLPLTLGKATRLTNYFLSSDKVYRGIMRFGFATDTYDLEGKPQGVVSNPSLERTRLEEIVARYQGKIHQTLPPYSAKKVNGKPMYAYARKGLNLEAATKEVTILSLRLLDVQGSEAEFELACSAGTFARSLAHDIGKDYGCGAHLIRLQRTKSGEFPIEKAIPLMDGARFYTREQFLEHLISLRDLLGEIPAIVLSGGEKERVSHGMDLNALTSAWNAQEYRLVDETGDLVAIATRLQTFASPIAQPAQWVRLHPRVIFQ
jgi:tRNA pseudouridine55 synthase